jgi:hypothetical protein
VSTPQKSAISEIRLRGISAGEGLAIAIKLANLIHAEFAFHQRISEELNTDFYFAHPYSSWEQ